MCLEVLHAVDDLDAGLFQLAGPGDIAGLVEARLQFHNDRYVLPVCRRSAQRPDDRAAGTGPVENLLDGQHIGIVRGLGDEAYDWIKTLERQRKQDVLAGDLLEEPLSGINFCAGLRCPRFALETVVSL